ncbi:hypothetical protein TpMuguga_01g01026 [Theileria parva strain Muguga]|uniref:Uncharacterized protein n=1 Tax=Theileria parva TaxID=5875 RepID=Q4N6Z4_THEPA|nr:uncharacterized protein TpMuguga_01g01026 [Theileria parva strain Muguga]EAN34264.1 hypothetical protein TpMuguga_01g01026 [Theileria parva strain Muguga]|eukprot:XP_766547.1 hypothetical protein [Theileria parva strain Muguga]
MNGLTKFSNIPSTKWLHFNFITSIYNLYTKNNTHPNSNYVRELPRLDHKSAFKPYEKEENEENDSISHLPGRLICHLNKHRESLLRSDLYYGNITKWAYYGLFSVVIYNWNSIHKREKLALMNSIVKIIRSISYNSSENNPNSLNLDNYKQSLIVFLKFILLSDSNTLSNINNTSFVSDNCINNWKYVYNCIHNCVNNLNSFDSVGNGTFTELVNECNYVRDFQKLFSVLYWVKSLKIIYSQLELLSSAVLRRLKSVYDEDCDLRDIINISYYTSMIDPKLLSDGFISDCLFSRFNNRYHSLNVIDCYHLLHFLKTYLNYSLGNEIQYTFLRLAFNILVNIHCYINNSGELDIKELEELSNKIFNYKVDLTCLNQKNQPNEDKRYYKLRVISNLLQEVSQDLGVLTPFCIKVYNKVVNFLN